MYKEDRSENTSLGGETVPAITKLRVTLKMIEAAVEHSDDHEIEEPVSPPACDPEEGPPLICFQSIEEIAKEVVDESTAFNSINNEEYKNSSQTFVKDTENISRNKGFGDLMKSSNTFPLLIPTTVSEIAEDLQTSPYKPPPTLHMSGGMVFTDMTLRMISVPTSVITSSTFKHSLAHSAAKDGIGAGGSLAEDKFGRDGGIDSVLQYFMRGDCVENAIELDTKTITEKRSHFTSTDLSQVCSNLPLDLSVARKHTGGGKVSFTGRGKRQREEEGQMICVTKKSFDRSRTQSNEKKEEMKSFDILQKMKEHSQVIQDQEQLFSKRSNLLNDSQGANQSVMESVNLTEELEVTKENGLPVISKMDDIDCRLILPGKKEDKARIVFASGLYVEIDREVFRNVEQKILGEKPKYQKTQSKSSINVASDSRSIRRKKVISRKQSKKQSSIVPMAIQNKTDCEGKQNTKHIEEKCNKIPKDMPMIVTNDCLDDEEHKTSKQLKVADKQLKSIPILKNAKTPPPSSTSSPGLHKLPSIVSKPSYYAKYENRKLCKLI
eukprot:GFUD01086045.1.p1 GENE.GFUD01086045.1~~GFUD01086045.1.p1  ORF type:complete len:551 (+),score=150.83 GFUD01086045.1:160-1812(+)